jgi:hypothetical protein
MLRQDIGALTETHQATQTEALDVVSLQSDYCRR